MAVETLLADDERQRLQSRYTEIASLAGGLAHEIRNPLSVINLNLDLLIEDVQADDSPRDSRLLTRLQAVQRECRRLETILEEFLRFTRLQELDLVECDFNQEVREFLDFFQPEAAAAGVDISPHLAPDLPGVRLDPGLFRQALMNLALNAQQAMPDGGLLELQTRSHAGRVELDLIDNGRGMDEATLGRIFDLYFSTRPGGSGLGLPMVKRIVEAHGGQISVDSAPGRGTRFTLSFPVAD